MQARYPGIERQSPTRAPPRYLSFHKLSAVDHIGFAIGGSIATGSGNEVGGIQPAVGGNGSPSRADTAAD
jgi:hypothetical protein